MLFVSLHERRLREETYTRNATEDKTWGDDSERKNVEKIKTGLLNRSGPLRAAEALIAPSIIEIAASSAGVCLAKTLGTNRVPRLRSSWAEKELAQLGVYYIHYYIGTGPDVRDTKQKQESNQELHNGEQR